MSAAWVAPFSALWLGVLTSISPCPLATNIAAISLVSRKLGSTRAVLLGGLAYTLGRAAAYLALGFLIVSGLLAVPGLSAWLQNVMPMLLGPLLILAGLLVIGWIEIPLPGGLTSASFTARLARFGIAGEFALGFVFALTFCPVSAALFFGSLIPLAIAQKSGVMLPGIYGIGSAVPVLIFALLLAFSAQAVGRWLDRLRALEAWATRGTAILLIAIGLYFSVTRVWLA